MNIRVVDARGQLLAQGRELTTLVEEFRSDTRSSVSAADESSPAHSGLTRWDIESLPEKWRFRQAGVDIESYPAMVDHGDTVAVELLDYPAAARLQHRCGVLRLIRLYSAQQVKYLRKQLLTGNQFQLALVGAGLDRKVILEDLIDAAFVRAMALNEGLPYEKADFLKMLNGGKAAVVGEANELEKILLNSLTVVADIRSTLAAMDRGKYLDTRQDIEAQLQRLLSLSFMRDTPAQWLEQYPRYAKALRVRLERLTGLYAKDQKQLVLLDKLEQPLLRLLEERPMLLLQCPAAAQYRWLLEEFRVSLWAQSLGTRQAVSEKRLGQHWNEITEWVSNNPH